MRLLRLGVIAVMFCAVTPVVVHAAAVATYETTLSDNTDQATFTFTDADIGTEAADRCVVVGIRTSRGTAVTQAISSATIGGNAATILKDHPFLEGGNSSTVGFISLLVPSGATATISVVMTQTMTRMIIAIWAVTGTTNCTSLADNKNSDANDPTVSLNVPANGTAVGVCAGTAPAGQSTTWTGLTERSDAWYESVTLASFGSADFTDAQVGLTVTCDFTGTSLLESGAFISFGPLESITGPPRGSFLLGDVGR